MFVKAMRRFGRVTLLAAICIAAGVSQGGCESRSQGTKVVGFPKSFADLAEKVRPAVVNISSTSTVVVPGNPFRHFFGPEDDQLGQFLHKYFNDVPDRQMKQQSLGSGLIIDSSGLIVTNNHVVDNADEIRVMLSDAREFKAKVIGRDPKTDLALLKISSTFEKLPVLPLGDSDRIRVGDWVLAVGNPFGLEHTVTQGIISATGRVIGSGPYDDFLQTDAAINPGNSGGPLIDIEGEVVGINSAIVAGGQGIGFAIPSNLAKNVISQLKEKGRVTRGWIGVAIQQVTPQLAESFGLKEARGALVSEVTPGGPAEKAGVKRGDIIISFAGKEVKTSTALPRLVAQTGVGSEASMTVIRSGKEVKLVVKVQELSEEHLSAATQHEVARLGMKVNELTPEIARELGIGEMKGVVVTGVDPTGAAMVAGIQPGDVIREIDRKPVKSLADYDAALASAQRGKPILFLVRRGKSTFYISLEVD